MLHLSASFARWPTSSRQPRKCSPSKFLKITFNPPAVKSSDLSPHHRPRPPLLEAVPTPTEAPRLRRGMMMTNPLSVLSFLSHSYVSNRVLRADNFNQAFLDHSCQVPTPKRWTSSDARFLVL